MDIKWAWVALTVLLSIKTTTSNANEIYVYQVGDNNALTLTQDGDVNSISGIPGETKGIEGDGNTIDMVQTGMYHGVQGMLDGDDNNVDFYQGGGGDSGMITARVTGDNNDLVIWQGKHADGTTDLAEGGDHTATVTITGNYNDIKAAQTDQGQINQTYGRHELTAEITGNSNDVEMTQRGNQKHLLDIDISGTGNDVTTYQRGNGGQKTADIELSGNYNVIDLNQRGMNSASANISVESIYGPAYNVTVSQQTDTSAKSFSLTGVCTNPNGCVVSVQQHN
jgi:hypothetical protein